MLAAKKMKAGTKGPQMNFDPNDSPVNLEKYESELGEAISHLKSVYGKFRTGEATPGQWG